MARIAIIGIGCRFPGGADDASSYWANLTAGRSAIGEIPEERWSLAGFHDRHPDNPQRSYARWGGFLRDIRGFDAGYFGLSPREAAGMDPQQRLLLMASVEAAQDAGLPVAALRAAHCGVFVGASTVDYGLMQRLHTGVADIQAGTGTALSIVANRVSNRLDLTGPSMGVDTACSSALVAIDTACRHLAQGSCGMALAGGVNILLDPRMFLTFSAAHMLSPTGRIRAFDAGADGFVRGEGVGVVVLERLEDAIKAGRRIYAVIEATAVNQDGRTGTITEPSQAAQVAMMRAAVQSAGIDPGTLAYAEAHGTGTPVGDPIEATAIGTVFGRPHRAGGPLPMGSAKTNIGHLEPAAGIAGLIKAALVLHHGHVPPSLGFERANPAIDLDGLGLAVPVGLQPLGDRHGPRRALVNAFGFGGTNACAILGEAPVAPSAKRPARADNDNPEGAPIAVPLSGPTAQHLAANAAALARHLEDGALVQDLGAIAAALATRRDHHAFRAVVIARDIEGLKARLLHLAEDRPWPQAERHAPPEIIKGRATPGERPRIVFTFTGQGGQSWSMGRELYRQSALFRQHIEAFDAVFRKAGGWSVVEALLATEEESRIHDAAITPAVMFAFQNALAEVWKARGVRPDIVLGHSFGEVTAAFRAGGLTMEEVARLVDQRGLIRHRVDRVGTMAAVGLGAEAIAPLLPADGQIEIGGFNAPDMVTLTGEEAAIDALVARLEREMPDVLARKLALDFAYHSSWFEPVEQIFMEAVGALSPAPPALPVVSTVTGALNDDFSTGYWWRNLRYPVMYQKAVEQALSQGGEIFIELGPHRTLSSMTAATAAAQRKTVTTVSTLDRRWGDLVSLAAATGQLWVAGAEIDWRAALGAQAMEAARDVVLPRTPWLMEEHWLEPEEAGRLFRPDVAPHPLLGRAEDGPEPAWRAEIGLRSQPYLGDHRIDDAVVFPAAGYIEMLYAAGRQVTDGTAIELRDVVFPAALYIGADDEVQLLTRYDAGRRRLTIHSRARGQREEGWTLRTTATLAPLDAEATEETVPPSDGDGIPAADFYRTALARGYGWGRQFQGLVGIRSGAGTASGEIDVAGLREVGCALDPRLVDSALQLTAFAGDEGAAMSLPAGIKRVRIRGGLAGRATARAEFARIDAMRATADVAIADWDGQTMLEARGIELRARRLQDGSGPSPIAMVERFAPIEIEPGARALKWIVVAAGPSAALDVVKEALRGCDVATCAPTEVTERISLARRNHLGLVLVADEAETPDCAASAAQIAGNAVAFAAAVARCAEGEIPARTIFVTRGARRAREADKIGDRGIAQATVLGVARTLAMEAPGVAVRLIDLGGAALDGDCAALAACLMGETAETELAIRNGAVLAARLEACRFDELAPARANPARSRNMALRPQGGAGIATLDWEAVAAPQAGEGEVLVEVTAAGLNFRDVMAATGLLPADAEPTPAVEALGLEFCGVARRVGADVTGIAPGERVIGMARGCLQRFVAVPRAALHPAPAGLGDDEAACLLSAYLTAWHALHRLARLAPGETVLIHSATGGVGLAAIAVARHLGARVIASAGTEQKRQMLRGMGIADVLDSRSLAFSDGVMAATGGRGVDVVLNALGGAFIERGIGCLAAYGRFVELGKRDVYADNPIGMRQLRANISLHVADLARLIEDRPEDAASMMGDVLALIDTGKLPPLPVRTYPAGEAVAAFETFAAARHTGKIAIRIDDSALPRRALAKSAVLDGEGTYLVTGGTRGFGLAVARWLVAKGAGHVVAASRSGRLDDGEASEGLSAVALDVTDADAVRRLVAGLVKDRRPLRGIVHAAVAYDDALLGDMTHERIGRVIAPKLAGAIHLTHAVEAEGVALDFLVSMSSLAQTLGWPGQSNYAAANAGLEALAHTQRQRGIPGLCLNLGMLGETGHVARSEGLTSYLKGAGFVGLDNETALSLMGQALDTDAPALTIAAADWARLAGVHSHLGRAPRTAGLVDVSAAAGALDAGLKGLAGPALQEALEGIVREETARVLRVAPETLQGLATPREAGIDSLSSFELHNRLERRLGVELPIARWARAARFADIAQLAASMTMERREAGDG